MYAKLHSGGHLECGQSSVITRSLVRVNQNADFLISYCRVCYRSRWPCLLICHSNASVAARAAGRTGNEFSKRYKKRSGYELYTEPIIFACVQRGSQNDEANDERATVVSYVGDTGTET